MIQIRKANEDGYWLYAKVETKAGEVVGLPLVYERIFLDTPAMREIMKMVPEAVAVKEITKDEYSTIKKYVDR